MAKEHFDITEVVCGMAKGVDLLGKQYGDEHNIPVKPFFADWKKLGKSAGPLRNGLMADYADGLILIWNGSSPGSEDMYTKMLKLGKPLFVRIIFSYEQSKFNKQGKKTGVEIFVTDRSFFISRMLSVNYDAKIEKIGEKE